MRPERSDLHPLGDTGGPSPAERAEVTCAQCKTRILDTYYAMGEKVICSTCRTGVQLTIEQGSGTGRFLRALFLGVPAAVLGSGIYYAVGAWTGYEFGLVAILIGLMVGGAVRYGSRAHGGWVYQILAVVLTYCSIASTYMPAVFEALRQEATEQQAAASGDPAEEEGAGEGAASDTAATGAMATSPVAAEAEGGDASASDLATALVVLFAIALTVPFFGGAENLMGPFIIGIGLYEAWKLNRRVNMEITGPHKLDAARA